MGELWGVFCEDFGENWPRYNITALYQTSGKHGTVCPDPIKNGLDFSVFQHYFQRLGWLLISLGRSFYSRLIWNIVCGIVILVGYMPRIYIPVYTLPFCGWFFFFFFFFFFRRHTGNIFAFLSFWSLCLCLAQFRESGLVKLRVSAVMWTHCQAMLLLSQTLLDRSNWSSGPYLNI